MATTIKKLTTKLTEQDEQQVKEFAQAAGMSPSEVMRVALAEYLSKHGRNFSGRVPKHGGPRRVKSA